jgi:hypothetical protein
MPIDPFATVTIGDANNGATNVDTLIIEPLASFGTLSGAGPLGSGGYTLTGTASQLTSALHAIVFTPLDGVPNTQMESDFGLSLTDPVTTGAASDDLTGVVVRYPAVAPTITGTEFQATTSEMPIDPFATVTIGDANNGATNVDTLTIALSGNGTLSGAGSVGAGDVYTLTGTAAALTTALHAMVFTPVDGVPNTSATTGFALDLTDPVTGGPVPDNTTTVIDSDAPVALTMTGIKSGQTTTSEMPIHPFASVMIRDANNGGTNVDTLTVSLFGGSGTLSGAGPAGAGDVYTLMGTAEQLTGELQAIVFTPVDGVPNTSVLNAFALVVKDPAFAFPGNSVGNDFTQVIDSDPAVAPTSTIAETVTVAPGVSPSISVTGVATDVDTGLASVTMNGGGVNLLGTDGDWAYSQMALASGSHSYVATITDNLGLHSSVTGSVVTVNNAKTIALAGTIGGDTVNASTGGSGIGITDTAANGGNNTINATNGNNKVAISDGAGHNTVNASGGNNTITINETSGGDDMLSASGGNNRVAISDGAGHNTVNASGGNNTISISDTSGGNNTLSVGGGNNSVKITDVLGKDLITPAGGNNSVTIGGSAGGDTIAADTNDTFTYTHLKPLRYPQQCLQWRNQQ